MKLKIAFYLLKALLAPEEYENITGDLEKDYHLLCIRIGKRRAFLKLYTQVAMVMWFLFPRAILGRIKSLIFSQTKISFEDNLLALHVEGNVVNKVNIDEVDEIENVVEQLIQGLRARGDNGIDENDIGIISPFRLQANAIKHRLSLRWPEFKKRYSVGTVTEFQGIEKRIIIASTYVCNSNDKSTQILNDSRLINVLITRAKEKFILIGNLEVLRSAGEVSSRLVEYINTLEKKPVLNKLI